MSSVCILGVVNCSLKVKYKGFIKYGINEIFHVIIIQKKQLSNNSLCLLTQCIELLFVMFHCDSNYSTEKYINIVKYSHIEMQLRNYVRARNGFEWLVNFSLLNVRWRQ